MQPKSVLLTIAVLIACAAILSLGGMIATALIGAAVFAASGFLTLTKLPKFAKRFLIKHKFIANLFFTTLAGLVVGVSTATGLLITCFTFLFIDFLQTLISWNTELSTK